MDARDPKKWFRVALAVLAVFLVTALAASAAGTRIKSLTLQPHEARRGVNVQGVIELSLPSPPGGVMVKLDSKYLCGGCGGEISEPDAKIYLPNQVFIPTGQTSGLFDVHVIDVRVRTTLVVSASLNEQKHSATVMLMP